MPRKDTKKKPATSANQKSRTPGPESQPVEENEFLNDLYDDQIKKAKEEKENLEIQLQKKDIELNKSAAEIERLKKELIKQQGTTQG